MVPAASKRIWLALFLSALPNVLGKVGAPTTRPCTLDFSPCTCIEPLEDSIFDNPAVNVTCNGDAFLDGDHLKATLRKPLQSVSIHLHLRNISFPLPVNLLGRNTLESIEVDCLDNALGMKDIELEAFEDTAFEASSATIKNCRLTDTSFRFLAPFHALKTFAIHGSHVTSFASFPITSGLSTVIFNQSTADKWHLDSRVPRLKRLVLVNLGKEQTLRILDNVALQDELVALTLLSTNLDAVPPQVRKFTQLFTFRMEGNPIKVLKKNAVQWKEMPRLLVLANNGIERIERGAFQGNFSSTQLVLRKNKLTALDAEVFQPILDSMAKSKEDIASIDLEGNPLSCGCDIGWLVKGDRPLLPYLKNANCINGTTVASFKQTDFTHCRDETSSAAATTKTGVAFAIIAALLRFTF